MPVMPKMITVKTVMNYGIYYIPEYGVWQILGAYALAVILNVGKGYMACVEHDQQSEVNSLRSETMQLPMFKAQFGGLRPASMTGCLAKS